MSNSTTPTAVATSTAPTALIAEDEPLLARALQAELAKAWPELKVVASVGDGLSAVKEALAWQPDVLFFDIRMPGLDGIEAAAELVDAWPLGGDNGALSGKPFPLLVFVTAYDQHALRAFEVHAVDYLLKPVQAARLGKTVATLQVSLARRRQEDLTHQPQKDEKSSYKTIANFDDSIAESGIVDQLRHLLDAMTGANPSTANAFAQSLGHSAAHSAAHSPQSAPPRLSVIQASLGGQIHMVPVDEVVYFDAADKYLRVVTATREYLIRTPLKELMPQLDGDTFWQIHRGTVVRAQAIAAVTRDESGKQHLSLRDRAEKLPVSRLYAQRFKPM
jgi:DNA-binding LytR/AlgR family response regulator